MSTPEHKCKGCRFFIEFEHYNKCTLARKDVKDFMPCMKNGKPIHKKDSE